MGRRTTGRSASSAGPSTRASRARPTARTGTGTPTSTRPPTAASSATPASCGGRRGSPRTRPACSATSRARTCSRWAPAPASAHAGCARAAGAAIGIDLSHRQLQHSRRIDEETGIAVPAVLGTATALPFADDSFDVVFSSFGALQFVADIDDAVAETARVLRPGGRYAFSITHPTRWMFPDDPGPAGLMASQSYWDRTPYVEVDDAHRHGGLRRAPPHPRRLGRAAGRPRLPAHRPARAGVARGPRPGLGWLVGHPRSAHPRDRAVRRGLGAAARPGQTPGADPFLRTVSPPADRPRCPARREQQEPAERGTGRHPRSRRSGRP